MVAVYGTPCATSPREQQTVTAKLLRKPPLSAGNQIPVVQYIGSHCTVLAVGSHCTVLAVGSHCTVLVVLAHTPGKRTEYELIISEEPIIPYLQSIIYFSLGILVACCMILHHPLLNCTASISGKIETDSSH
jgi:hypothetical protein